MEHNCYNCKYKIDMIYPLTTRDYCKKQHSWINSPLRICPKFKASLWAVLLGDRTPYIQTEKLVGGCEEEKRKHLKKSK